MLEDLAGIATQSMRLLELAKDAGIEPSWKLLAFMGASWALAELARKTTVAGSCAAAKACQSFWKWFNTEKPLCEEEQILVDCLANGIYDPKGDSITGIDGQTEACISGRRVMVVVADGEVTRELTDILSDRAHAKIRALINRHRALVDAQERETARHALVRLKRTRAKKA